MDKIGLDGVREELARYEYSQECIDKYTALFEELPKQVNPLSYMKETLGDFIEEGATDNLS